MTSPTNKGTLARLWDALKAFQERVAIALTVVLLFALYFTVFAVVAILARLFGKDLLHTERPEPGTWWLRREAVDHALESFVRQF